jgi:hypothetical protein
MVIEAALQRPTLFEHRVAASLRVLYRDGGAAGDARHHSAAPGQLVYLPLYSPDLDLIKEFFAVLKACIRKRWREYEESLKQDLKSFLRQCIDIVGSRYGTQVLRLRSFKFGIGIAFRCRHCYEDIKSCLIYRVNSIISIFPNEPHKTFNVGGLRKLS